MSKPKKSEIALTLAQLNASDLDELTVRVAAVEEVLYGATEEASEDYDLDHCEQCNDYHDYLVEDEADDYEESTAVAPEVWPEMINRVLLRAEMACKGAMAVSVDSGNLRTEAEADTVNHPSHYANDPSGVECIEITQYMNFNLGNAFKYLFRAGRKGNMLEDLRKALWYVERQIELTRATGSHPTAGSAASHAFAVYDSYRQGVSEELWNYGDDDAVARQYDDITDAMRVILSVSGLIANPFATLERAANSIGWAIQAQEELEAAE